MSTSTQPATSSVDSPHAPWMPPEIVSLILTKLWEEPLCSDERASSLQNIVLVNRTWRTLFTPIASRDVHVFNERATRMFLANTANFFFLKGQGAFLSEASHLIRERCCSVTFHVDGNAPWRSSPTKASPAVWEPSQADEGIVQFLYMIGNFGYRLPNLRHMSLRYTDWAYDDVLEQIVSEVSFPKQVTHVSVDYAFSEPASVPAFESATTLTWSRPRVFGRSPNLKRLSFSGVSTRLVKIMVRVIHCLNLETLEIAHPEQLTALVPLPAKVHTLVLCHPGIAISKTTMTSWALDTALDAGLFGEGIKPRIVVRSGTPDPVAFVELRQACRAFDVDLVYERDDFRRRGC